MDAGLKPAVTPAGSPVAERLRAELKPPVTEVESVTFPDVPCGTERLCGEAARLKPGAVAALMVRATVLVCVIPPPVAVTVTLVVPVAAVLLAENVSVELPFPGAAMEAGLK